MGRFYAWIAANGGDQSRARTLIDLVAVRSPWDFLVCCHAKARIAGWPVAELHARAVEWREEIRLATVRGGEGRTVDMASALDAEVARWL